MTLIADIDGTVFKYGTTEFVDNALQELTEIVENGGQIVFITAREKNWPGAKSVKTKLMREFPEAVIVWGSPSPRVIINDEGARAINHSTNAKWRKI